MKNSNLVKFEGSTIDLTKGRRSQFVIKPGEEVKIIIKEKAAPNEPFQKKKEKV